MKDMAVMASQTVCAPLSTELTFDPRGVGAPLAFDPRLVTSVLLGQQGSEVKHHHGGGLAEKLHGITEKLTSLGGGGHSRTDSTGDLGRRSRAGGRT